MTSLLLVLHWKKVPELKHSLIQGYICTGRGQANAISQCDMLTPGDTIKRRKRVDTIKKKKKRRKQRYLHTAPHIVLLKIALLNMSVGYQAKYHYT